MVPDAPVLERTLLRDVDAALDPLRRKQRELQAFLASQLERLELQAGQVEVREQELINQTDALTKERSALDEEWAHFDQLVETARGQALEVRQQRQKLEMLIAENSSEGRQAELRRVQDALDHVIRERDALDHELANAKRKLGELADVSVELTEARVEIERLRARLAAHDSAGYGHPPAAPPSTLHAHAPPAHAHPNPTSPAAAPLDDMLSQLDAVRRDSARHRHPRRSNPAE